MGGKSSLAKANTSRCPSEQKPQKFQRNDGLTSEQLLLDSIQPS
jgi:hypothetical protein